MMPLKSVKLVLCATVLTVTGLLVGSCSLLRPSPAKDSGFIPFADKLMEMRERSPFNGVYYADRDKFYENRDWYTKLYITPIHTEYLEQQIQKHMRSKVTQDEDIEDARSMASYMRQRFINAMIAREDIRFETIEKSEVDERSLILEMNIAELEPTGRIANAAISILGFFIPGTGIIKTLTKGSVAMEALIKDGRTGAILVAFKDRKVDKAAAFTVRDFERYAHDRLIIDDWATEFAELSATNKNHRVSEPLPFTLNPF